MDDDQRIETFKERVLAESLALVVDPKASRDDRGMAAGVAGEILDHVNWNEARAAEVLTALRRCVDDRREAYSAVVALVDVIRRKQGRHPEKVSAALARIAERAHARGFMMSLHAVLLVMLGSDAWAVVVQPACIDAVIRWACTRPVIPGLLDPAGELLDPYLRRFGSDHAWLRAVVRDHPCLLESHWLPFDMRQELHCRAPTAEGWRHFAGLASQDLLAPWTADGFGSEFQRAVETLAAALQGARSAHPTGPAVAIRALAAWLEQLQEASSTPEGGMR